MQTLERFVSDRGQGPGRQEPDLPHPGMPGEAGLSSGRNSGSNPAIPVYALLIGFLVMVAALGMVGGGGAARALFVVGCLGVAFQAYRTGGLPLHAEVCIVLFVFAALLRRMIDVRAGYDASGMMLIGPLAAVVVVLPELQRLLSRHAPPMQPLLPYMLMVGCVMYGWALSSFQGNLLESSIGAIKYIVPLLYCMCLILRPDQSDAVLKGAARAFLVVSPLIGIYGVWQHLAPLSWDQYWMVSSKIPSIGQPFSGQVRVFSTMNSPVSFAAYATCGLLLFSFIPRSFIPPVLVPVVAILPLCLAILLTSVRTAWISAAVSLLFCLLYGRTRGRAGMLMVCLGLGIAFALLFTSFGDVISDRFATMDSSAANDGSGNERMGDYIHVFSEDSRYIFGLGLAPVVGDSKMAALDGQVLMSAYQMGTTIGVLHLLCVVWAGVQGLLRLRRDEAPLRLVAGALVVGNLAILPLTAVTVGEIGFLFWMLVGILTIPVTRGAGVRQRYGSQIIQVPH